MKMTSLTNSMNRKSPDYQSEYQLLKAGYSRVAGVDEAGRGCLAGPVVAAAVILDPGARITEVRDSKKLSSGMREHLRSRIFEHAVSVGIGICSPSEIDELNILWASMEAMRRALENLNQPADVALVDGNTEIPDSPCPQQTIVSGDATCESIAAASIIAKTERDAIMFDLSTDYAMYGWDTNKGYPTRAHYDALVEYGPSRFHRKSFRLTPRYVH